MYVFFERRDLNVQVRRESVLFVCAFNVMLSIKIGFTYRVNTYTLKNQRLKTHFEKAHFIKANDLKLSEAKLF